MLDASLHLEVMRLPDYGLVFIELSSPHTWPHARAVLPALGGAFVASWHAAQRHGGLGGPPLVSPRAGAGWLLERTRGDTVLAKRQSGAFARDALGAGESGWWREITAQLSRIPNDAAVPPRAY